jgi:hypothetical protein
MPENKKALECRICGKQIKKIMQGLYHAEDDKWSHHRCFIDKRFSEVNESNR